MAFDSLNRYSPHHKTWDHVGNIIPDVEHSEGERPAGEFRPAAWLPVQFFDKKLENWIVVMPGKIVSFDPDGNLMPAEYGISGATVTYAQNDVDAGTIDVSTGLAVTTTKVVTLSTLTGVRDGTWTAATAGVTTVTSGFMGRFGDAFLPASTPCYPVGVAPYAYLQFAGDTYNPVNYYQHNYSMQNLTAFLCDYVLKLPVIPAASATEGVNKTTSGTLVSGTIGTHTRAQAVASATGRYNATYGTVPVLSTYPVIAFALNEVDMAKNTVRSTVTMQSNNTADDVSSVLVNERTSLSGVVAAGDYLIDYSESVLFVYSSDGATVPVAISGAAGTVSVTYYHYSGAATTVSKFASVLGNALNPGDFLKVGANSNFVKADPAGTAGDLPLIIGQLIKVDTFPRGGLDKVRTAYNPAIHTNSAGSMANGSAGSLSVNVGQLDQMPGTATGGVNELIHYAGAANQLAYVNLIWR